MRLRPSWLVMATLAAAACGGSGSSSSNNASGQQVMIADFYFSPQTLNIKAGTTVTWANQGPSAHQIVSDDTTWQSGNLVGPSMGDPYYGGGTQGGTFQRTFTNAGTYPYHCGNHPPSMAGMAGFTGTIVVSP